MLFAGGRPWLGRLAPLPFRWAACFGLPLHSLVDTMGCPAGKLKGQNEAEADEFVTESRVAIIPE